MMGNICHNTQLIPNNKERWTIIGRHLWQDNEHSDSDHFDIMSITVSCQNYGCVKNLFPVFMIVKSQLTLLSYWLKRYLRFSLYLSPQSLWKAGKEHVSSNKTSKHHLGSCLCFFLFWANFNLSNIHTDEAKHGQRETS